MKLARVVGTVWGTVRAAGLDDLKLLEVQPMRLGPSGELEASGGLIVAVDRLQAGPGELVILGHGSRIRDIGLPAGTPVKDVVVAIVDDTQLQV